MRHRGCAEDRRSCLAARVEVKGGRLDHENMRVGRGMAKDVHGAFSRMYQLRGNEEGRSVIDLRLEKADVGWILHSAEHPYWADNSGS